MSLSAAGSSELEIDDREELIFFLTEAAELEHLLCCSYLYAAFSLKTDRAEGVSPLQLQAITGWGQQIRAIAVQEMGHLARVSNLLTALGGAPHFGRPNFPQQGKYYPAHLPLSLTPFSEDTLERFIDLERPEGPADGPEPHLAGTPPPTGAVVPTPQTYPSVGVLYAGIEQGLRTLVDRLGEPAVFIAPSAAQAAPGEIPLAGVEPVTNLATAIAAIRQIVDEGEGQPGDRTDTHYHHFQRIQAEYRALLAADPSFTPARPTLTNPSTRPLSDATGVTLVAHPTTRGAMELFNGTYALMVQVLARYFTRGAESQTERATLLEVALALMSEVLTPLGNSLTRQPAQPPSAEPDGIADGHPRRVPTAGPSFEFHRAIQALPHRSAAWIRFQERARALAIHAERLAGEAEAPRSLEEIRQALLEVADRLVLARTQAPSA